MAKKWEVYKCDICDIVLDISHKGFWKLFCCGKPMQLMQSNTVDASLEKHVPIFKKTETEITVTVWDVIHPMDDNHYIEWIEVVSNWKNYREYLEPGQEPVATFKLSNVEKIRTYCNLHWLWETEVK